MGSVNLAQDLWSFLHSHRLCLHPEMMHRVCDVCREPIEGTFYRCNCCDFDVHPNCTQLPQQIRHVSDANHKLTLHKLSSGRCSVCEADCSSLWVYGCSLCQVNIHPLCIPKPYSPRQDAPGTRTRGMRTPTPQQQQQPHHFHAGYPNFVGGGGYNAGYGVGNYWYNHNTYYPPPPPLPPYNYYHYNANPGPNYGGHTPSASPSTITLGSLSTIGGAMFALVQNLAAGAIIELVFGA